MSLDNIQLTPIVLESLYSKSLYDLNPANESKKPSGKAGVASLGECRRHVVVLVDDPGSLYLPEDDLNFLLGIMNACKLSMADIALINLNKNKTDYTAITDQFGTETVLLFGTDPETIGLPLQFPHYQLQRFNNQVYLSAVSLSELQRDKTAKLNLWNSLKKVFALN
jgi:hypothetical protein